MTHSRMDLSRIEGRQIMHLYWTPSLTSLKQARKRPLYVCYVDFKSAFDHVHRSALLYKLFVKGIGDKYFRLLKSMYKKAKSRVKWNSQLGRIFENLRGVLQGGVISPTLFNVFLEDISDYLDKNKGITVRDIVISISYLPMIWYWFQKQKAFKH